MTRPLSPSLTLSLSISLSLSLSRSLSRARSLSLGALVGALVPQRLSSEGLVHLHCRRWPGRERERERERGRVIPPASQGREKIIDHQIDDLRTLAFSAHRQRCLSLENLTVALSCLSVSIPLCLSSSLSTMEGTPSYQLLCVTIFAFLFFA